MNIENVNSRQNRLDQVAKKNNMPQYKRINDAVFIPDVGFSKQLQALDPELAAVYDWGSEYFSIWRFPTDKNKLPFHMIDVKTKNKEYRELGADILLKLQEFDPWRYDSLNQLVNYFDILDKQAERRRRKDFLNRVHDISSYVDNKLRQVVQVQVPRVLQDCAVMIDIKPEPVGQPLTIDLPKEVRARRTINETGTGGKI